MNSLNDINIDPRVRESLERIQWTTLTDVQRRSIPSILEGRDLIACAQTGTGKTGAYLIPVLERLVKNPQAQALVLAPTRELAQQIEKVWAELSVGFNAKRACLIGGLSMFHQTKALQAKPALVIATPGRLIDHMDRGNFNLQPDLIVLDEADRMLDMGFAPQVERALRDLPRRRQTLLFSATWDTKLEAVFKGSIHDPVRIVVGRQSATAVTVDQSARIVANGDKNEALLAELASREGTAIVFVRTKHKTDKVAKFLDQRGVGAGRLHGNRTQGQRNATMQAFRDGEIRVLVATDIAARGLDVSHVSQVINLDLPQVAEDYVHRIGRTGRAGLSGEALSFVAPEELPLWREIEKLLASTKSSMPKKHGFPAGPAPRGAAPTLPAHARPTAQRPTKPARGGFRTERPNERKSQAGRPSDKNSFANRFGTNDRPAAGNRSEARPARTGGPQPAPWFAKGPSPRAERRFDKSGNGGPGGFPGGARGKRRRFNDERA